VRALCVRIGASAEGTVTIHRRFVSWSGPALLQVISDLLKPERTNLVIREDRKRGVFVDGLSEWVVRTPQEVRQTLA